MIHAFIIWLAVVVGLVRAVIGAWRMARRHDGIKIEIKLIQVGAKLKTERGLSPKRNCLGGLPAHFGVMGSLASEQKLLDLRPIVHEEGQHVVQAGSFQLGTEAFNCRRIDLLQ
jgi:hypothetical protein